MPQATARQRRKQARKPAKATGTKALRAAASEGQSLEKMLFGRRVPRAENDRTYYGRSLNLDRIERALRNAAHGAMIDVTDLGRETLRLDGHLTGLVQKRLNRAAAIPYKIVANDGGGERNYDFGRANEYADFVRRQVLRIPRFRDFLIDVSWSTWDGRSASEIDWAVVPGRDVGDSKLPIGWRAKGLNWIHPRRLSFTQNRELVVIDTWGENGDFRPTGFPLSQLPEKFVVSTPRLFGDYPEFEGLNIRSLYWSFFQRLGTRERLQLMEVFAAPWRIAYSESETPINEESLTDSFEILSRMNSRNAAWLPQGVKALIVQPGAGASVVHKETIEDARFVLSKMILGATGTTDAVSTGLGSSIGDAHLSEEDLIIAADLLQRADVVEDLLTDRIIEMNYGPEALAYAPKFQFELKALTDRGKEIGNLKASAEAGLRIPLEQAYELTGYRQPRENEAYIAMVHPPSDGMVPSTPRTVIVWPPGKAPPPGDLAIEPEEGLGLDAPDRGGGAPPSPGPAPSETPPASSDVPKEPEEPAAPAAPTSPDEPVEPQAPRSSEDDTELAFPFESPSGLSADQREKDDDEPTTASRSGTKPKRRSPRRGR